MPISTAARTGAYRWNGNPTSSSTPSASLIQCATHGALFLIESGECVAGPCAGQFLAALDSREDEQGIWVEL